MDIKVLKKDENKVTFQLKGSNPAMANALRRYMLAYVPTMAIDTVEIKKNGSAFFDEMLALRLGLVPLTTDLKGYKIWEGADEDRPKTAQYELKMTVKKEGPCMVYASDITSTDPKVVPASEKIPVMKLLEGQAIEIIATARLGRGKEHAKYSPGLVIYRGVPQLEVTKDANVKVCMDALGDVLEKKGTGLGIKDITRWNEAHEEMCEANGVAVTSSKEDFMFTIESWGQLPPREIMTQALTIFETKLSDFESGIKKLK